MPYQSLTPAKYAQQMRPTATAAHGEAYTDLTRAIMERHIVSAATLDEVPVADSPEDVTTRTIPLDGGTAIVEHVGDRVEVTVRIGYRLTTALVLSRDEASALGAAIARPDGPTIGDLFTVADAMHADASTLARAWGTAQPV